MQQISVESLKQAKEEAGSVAYQKFVLLINIAPDDLFCFFENKDAPYYHSRIKAIFSGKPHYISCGNKKLVIKVFNLIKLHTEYNKFKTAFFIDRDFDPSIKNQFPEIYETPAYSIENFYCGVESFSEFLKAEFQIGQEDSLYTTLVDLYKSLLNEFLDASLLFNAWYKLQKVKSKALNIDNNVSLTPSLIPSYIELSVNSIIKKYTIQDIVDEFPMHIPYTSEELKASIEEIEAFDLRLYTRGKYVFNFMTGFIRKLIEDGGKTGSKIVMAKKVKYNLDNSTALSLLTSYAETPECLSPFLHQYN